MKNPTLIIRQSLSAKLSIWIVLFALAIFAVSLGFMFKKSLETVQREAINRATQLLENTVWSANTILMKVETATNNTEARVIHHLDSPEMIEVCARHIITANPFLSGCSISFEPYYFKDKGRWFSIFASKEDGEVTTEQEGNEKYDYHMMDWYLIPKMFGKPGWTEPYIDYDPEDTSWKELVVSYCKPLRDSQGKYVGTISVDISLDMFVKTVASVKPYPHSYAIMIGEGGNYFVHPDSTKLLYETIFTETLLRPDTALTALGHAMQRGEEGMRQLKIDGEDCYVFYKPLSKTGWSVGLVCPESDIFEGYNRLQHRVEIIVAAGLLLMLIIFIRIISSEMKPLKRLVQQAGTIASGHLDQTLPKVNRMDEIGQLSQSFGDMQQSLISYIEELKETTATKAAIDNELKIASDIQMSMLPSQFPPFPERKDIDLYASMTPAKEVGGDLYNFLLRSKSAGCKTGRPSNDDCLYFALGDVSGKGVPASLFMAQTTRLFRTLAGEGFSPEDIANRMNSGLCEGNDTMMFVTLFIGLVHLQTGQLEFCNCGHNTPLIDGQFLTCKYKNLPLGLFDDIPFKGESIDDIRGKQLLVYTDGLNEAMNREGELLGNERLQEIMAHSQTLTASQVVEMLKEAVEKHRDGAEPNDDLTLLCLRISKNFLVSI